MLLYLTPSMYITFLLLPTLTIFLLYDFFISKNLLYFLSNNQYFKTPFARLWTHNNNPKSSHKDLRHID